MLKVNAYNKCSYIVFIKLLLHFMLFLLLSKSWFQTKRERVRERESARASDDDTAQFSFAAIRAHALVAALPAVTKTNMVPQNVNATT